MRFLDRIIDYILDIALFFLDISHEVRDWGYWARWAADFLVDVADAFARMAYRFEQFNDWVSYVAGRVEDIFSLSEIRLSLKTWLDYATWAWNWIRDAPSKVGPIIEDWWGTVIPTVYGWIAIATQGLAAFEIAWDEFWTVTFPQWTGKLDNLKAAWDNFWTVTFPTLVSFTKLTTWWGDRLLEVQGLIDSLTLDLEPLSEGWQDIREKVFEFFDDPLEFIWARFTNWFLGPEA